MAGPCAESPLWVWVREMEGLKGHSCPCLSWGQVPCFLCVGVVSRGCCHLESQAWSASKAALYAWDLGEASKESPGCCWESGDAGLIRNHCVPPSPAVSTRGLQPRGAAVTQDEPSLWHNAALLSSCWFLQGHAETFDFTNLLWGSLDAFQQESRVRLELYLDNLVLARQIKCSEDGVVFSTRLDTISSCKFTISLGTHIGVHFGPGAKPCSCVVDIWAWRVAPFASVPCQGSPYSPTRETW